MATPAKTVGTTLFALANTALSSVSISSAQDVSTKIAAAVLIHFGRASSSAFTTAPTIRIEASAKGSGDGFWFPIALFSPALGASLTAQAVNGTCASGQNVVPLAATTNFAVGDIVYIKNTTIANGEFGRVKTVTAATSITLEDNLNSAQTGATVYRAAEMYSAYVDTVTYGRLRAVVDNSANAVAGIDVEIFLNTFDNFT